MDEPEPATDTATEELMPVPPATTDGRVPLEGDAGAPVNSDAAPGEDDGQAGADTGDTGVEDEAEPALLRQPIVAVLGHVDHGKTSLLDLIRGTTVVAREAGAITQHIGATEIPFEALARLCGDLIPTDSIELPGLLFIDTPGHHSFTTLRARGGALADLAVLVVDLNEGFKPQTLESLNILRRCQTPFVVALNKLDLVPGWRTRKGSFLANAKRQKKAPGKHFQERFAGVVNELAIHGFDARLFSQVRDFTRTIGLVPTSAHSGEGLAELFMVLMGLAQRYLRDRLHLSDGPAEGTVLELKEERGLGKTLGVIIYNGVLRATDSLVIGGHPEPVVTRVKTILRPKPMDEIRDPRQRFDVVTQASAAAGLKLVAPHLDNVTPGVPLHAVPHDRDVADALVLLRAEMALHIECAETGLVVKGDAVGSLEALAYELKEAEFPLSSAAVGDVSRRDVVQAATMPPMTRAILAFNVKVLPDARQELADSGVRIFESQVIYELVESYGEWRAEQEAALARAHREEFAHPGKFLFLEGCAFRNRDPAVIGVRVLAGRIAVGQEVLKPDNTVIGHIRSMRSGEKALKEATQGDEVAVAVTKVTVGRQVNEGDVFYIEMRAGDVQKLRKAGVKLTPDEEDVLTEMERFKRKDHPFWGR